MLQDQIAEQNYRVALSPETVADYASRDSLTNAEVALFRKYADFIHGARVLDIGVGGGRTSLFLLSRCQDYTGLDYSRPMIEACRTRLPFCKDAFIVGDARNLQTVCPGPYDFVLFAFAGIDALGYEDRLKVFAEARAVLADDGLFHFSAHSLHAFPFAEPEVQARNAHLDPADLRRRGWVQLTDRRADVVLYYTYPDFQVRQLETSGFDVLDVLDMRGNPFDFAKPQRDWLVSFMCRKR